MSVKSILSVTVAVSAAVSAAVLISCGGSKTRLSPEEQEIQKVQSEMRLDSIRGAAELQKFKQQNALAEEKARAAENERLAEGSQMRSRPCGDSAIEPIGYMVGFGQSKPKATEQAAMMEANQAALNEMAARFVGVMKSATDRYSKNAEVSSGREIDQNVMEGATRVIGEKVVNQYARRTCYRPMQDRNGGWLVYQTLKISLAEALTSVATELEALKLDVDKARYLDAMDRELNAENKRRVDELSALEARRNELSGER